MNPAVTSPVFVKDEMGMDYIPVYADHEGVTAESAGTVKIDPVVVQNIGVRTAKVGQRSLSRELNALGRIDFNEEKLSRLHPKTSGWIEELKVDETGVQVNRDTILLSIYSPDLVAAQSEYLVALRNWETVRHSENANVRQTSKNVLDSARERLELFDVPLHQIKELEQDRQIKKRLHIHSPFAGRVMQIGAREGQYVTPKDELYLIADLARIWVYVEIYEDESPWVRVGDMAEMTVRAVPTQVFKGKVSFIYPTLDGKSRTVRVRLEFDNPDLMLKPGMFANVTLHADTQPKAVVVPSEAIVRTGSREQVYVVRAPGKFEPRPVKLGFSANGYTQVLDGISPGEEVVVSSQFLIDSESKLREATAKMMEVMTKKPGGSDMGDMGEDEGAMVGMSHARDGEHGAGHGMSGKAMPEMTMDHEEEGGGHDH